MDRKRINSRDVEEQKAILDSLAKSIINDEKGSLERTIGALKGTKPNIQDGNVGNYIRLLHLVYRTTNGCFDDLPEEIKRLGTVAAISYVFSIHYETIFSIDALNQCWNILKRRPKNERHKWACLAKMYEIDATRVVTILKRRFKKEKVVSFPEPFFIYSVNQTGNPSLREMIETLLPPSSGVYVFERSFGEIFPNVSGWISWCNESICNKEIEGFIARSLKAILIDHGRGNGLDETQIDSIMDMVATLLERKGLDYGQVTSSIEIRDDLIKQKRLQALLGIRTFLEEIPKVDIILVRNRLKTLPNLVEVIGEERIFSGRHPFAEAIANELHFKVQGKRDILDYWEENVRIVKDSNCGYDLYKLSDCDETNLISALAEVEVATRLLNEFGSLHVEPKVAQFPRKRIDFGISCREGEALIEVAVVNNPLEAELCDGGGIPGDKVKKDLNDKLKDQFYNGKRDPQKPILVVLCIEGDFIDEHGVMDSLYGQFYTKMMINLSSGEAVGSKPGRMSNGFFHLPGAEIVSGVAVYHRKIRMKDPLVGRIYRSFNLILNEIPSPLYVRLRRALFGTSEGSDWRSMTKIKYIDEEMASRLYEAGIDDIFRLSQLPKGTIVEGVNGQELIHLSELAKQTIVNME